MNKRRFALTKIVVFCLIQALSLGSYALQPQGEGFQPIENGEFRWLVFERADGDILAFQAQIVGRNGTQIVLQTPNRKGTYALPSANSKNIYRPEPGHAIESYEIEGVQRLGHIVAVRRTSNTTNYLFLGKSDQKYRILVLPRSSACVDELQSPAVMEAAD